MQLYYPFNRFRRIEFLMDVRTENESHFVLRTQGIDSLAVQEETLNRRFWYAIPGLALVQDNTSYSGFTPIAGGRWRAEFYNAFGQVEYQFALLDWRRYYNVHRRGALAVRLLTAGSWGRNQQLLRIGGPETYRGADFSEMIGTRTAIANIEARFPIFPSTELIRGVIFFDAAATWFETTGFDADRINTAVGFGVRFHRAASALRCRFASASGARARERHREKRLADLLLDRIRLLIHASLRATRPRISVRRA
jgi:hemolysin activation/secretion protein